MGAVVALAACTALGLFALGRVLDNAARNREERCARETASKLEVMRSLLPEELPTPPGAVLDSRREYGGDCTSDDPAIEWRYRYTGTPAQFVEFYAGELTQRGWRSETTGNLPGQLKNFSKLSPDHRYGVVLYGPAPGLFDSFVVSLHY